MGYVARPASCALQLGELPASIGVARWREALVADHASGEADQDRGEGGASCPIRDLPDGGGRRPSKSVPADLGENPATATADNGLGIVVACRQNMQNGRGDGGGLFACR